MRILMIFLDGIGLGDDDPTINPFATANTPILHKLSNNKRWLRSTRKQTSTRATFIPTDPRLGVPGRPQSATGQATILTGRNIPQIIGEHYGPRPNEAIRRLIPESNIFKSVVEGGKTALHAEAYPPRWHDGITSRKRLPSSYQQAAQSAGLPFMTEHDLRAGHALSGDWTGAGWATHLNIPDIPELSPYDAGVQLVNIARGYDFTFFSHWHTDIVGHRGPLEDGIALLETFDGVMRGVLDCWDDSEGLIIITSDHGNLEDVGDRHHTENDVPTVIIGEGKDEFAEGLTDLTGFVPRMERLLLES
jgi:hypothetical protein